ncbi:anhydro-N-acetylmuramic acid kinase [Moorena sp. SIO4G3]|uniref:anhydro-N-acetylmuramic acid kinase n=1 Tax=Moorena sp. SIO4G3 TaxID=2607821 RepID=UPI00142B3E17|nr:anhydro-N-acetylmuramic acid kinase [Moorena sp. SIO4G3]NEO80285.1 anhydro-N-acetylmuramic acid kinase [Moorena sp. SIO4G3]
MTRVIGLMSGTSVDGIDAALVEISGSDLDLKIELLAGATYGYPTELREKILAVCAGSPLSIAEFAALDDAIAFQFAQAALAIGSGLPPAELIGSHGQTVYHRPLGVNGVREQPATETNLEPANLQPANLQPANLEPANLKPANLKPANLQPLTTLGYSLQLGRGEVIAEITGIKTISNFRVADIAAGGEGAPLVPKIDACLLRSSTHNRCIQNIGGISNVTYLPVSEGNWLEQVYGWDTGPGNALLDLAVEYFTNGSKTYDYNGEWAASGTPCEALVEQWLAQEFFKIPPPKSTGRELFSLDYLNQCLVESEAYNLAPADFLATLTELTVASIVESYRNFLPHMPDEVLLCGGGASNLYLKQRLQIRLDSVPVLTTDQVGLSRDFKEAIAFAVLAYWRNLGIPGNLPQVTGASEAVCLGNLYSPRSQHQSS